MKPSPTFWTVVGLATCGFGACVFLSDSDWAAEAEAPTIHSVVLRPSQRQHVPLLLLILSGFVMGAELDLFPKWRWICHTRLSTFLSLSYLYLCELLVTCSVGNGTDWKRKVAMTVMTVMRMRMLLVMTTIMVITLPSVFGGEVSVSRHFKGDIFSQEGKNNKREESWGQFWWLAQNNPNLVEKSSAVTTEKKRRQRLLTCNHLTLPLAHLKLSSNYNQICFDQSPISFCKPTIADATEANFVNGALSKNYLEPGMHHPCCVALYCYWCISF